MITAAELDPQISPQSSITSLAFAAATRAMALAEGDELEALHDHYLACLSVGAVVILLDDADRVAPEFPTKLGDLLAREPDFARCGNRLLLVMADEAAASRLADFATWRLMRPTLSQVRLLLSRHGVDAATAERLYRMLLASEMRQSLGESPRVLLGGARVAAKVTAMPWWPAFVAVEPPTWVPPNDLSSMFSSARELASRPDAAATIIASVRDPDSAEGEIPAMAIGLLPHPETMLEALAALPDLLDMALLRLRLRAMRYIGPTADAIVVSMAQTLATLVSSPERCPRDGLRRIAAECAGAQPALAAAAREHIEPLIGHESDEIRCRAATVVGAARLPDAAAILAPLLSGANLVVREVTANAIAESGDVDAPTILRHASSVDAVLVRRELIDAIGRVDDGAAVQTLVAMVEDATLDPGVRIAALEALARRAGRNAVGVLIAALDDTSICRAAAQALQPNWRSARCRGAAPVPSAGLATRASHPCHIGATSRSGSGVRRDARRDGRRRRLRASRGRRRRIAGY